MATFDIFNSNAFTTTSLLAAIEKVPFKPSYLGSLGIFVDRPLRTEWAWVEERDGTLNVIQTTPRGAPKVQRTTEKRTARAFRTSRIAKTDSIKASELLAIREFGSETELMQVMAEVMRRLSGPVGLIPEVELTWENMRLGAVQGIVTDADSTVIMNWFTEFGISQPAEIAFDLTGANAYSTTTAVGLLRSFIADNVVRPLRRAAKGLLVTDIVALCGDNFFDKISQHGEVRTTFLNTASAADLRQGIVTVAQDQTFGQFRFADVLWVNYRGMDDGSTVSIPTDKVKFVPIAPGLFQTAWSPGESIEDVGGLGRPITPRIVPDPTTRQEYVDIDVTSYPLMICTRPEALYRGRWQS